MINSDLNVKTVLCYLPGKTILHIVTQLSLINDELAYQHWLKQLYNWHKMHKTYSAQKSFSVTTNRYGYKHKMVRRAFIHLKNALSNMFHFLHNNKIPKSTNGLESFFGHLKSHLLLHRRLTKEHRKNFIKWYLYFRNNH